MNFDRERAAFLEFGRQIAGRPAVREQMEQAIEDVYWTYDTTIWENRFIVGGTIEFILGSVLRACGIPVKHRGATKIDLDLVFEDGDGGFSVKAILKGTGTRLVNVMGVEPTPERWRSATLFMIPGLGIVYADPAIDWWVAHRDQCIRPTKDALQVSAKCVGAFASSDPKWVVECRLPRESDRPSRAHPARTASADVAAQVLMHYSDLFSVFAGLKPWEEARGYREH